MGQALLKRLSDNSNHSSLAHTFRKKRFEFFLSLLQTVPPPIRLLDVGGTRDFWEKMGTPSDSLHVTLLNVFPTNIQDSRFTYIVGDGRDLSQFADGAFDVVFSNSVIEHLPTFADQARMSSEIQRVGKRYFVQTPNYYFPLEPHFLVLGFQFFPLALRAWLLSKRTCGWVERVPDRTVARQVVEEIRLLKKKELKTLFPAGEIFCEPCFGLTKSFVAYGGWPYLGLK